MKRFTFANLVGGRKAQAEGEDDLDAAPDDEEEGGEAAAEDREDTAAEDAEETDDAAEAEEETSAEKAARRRGVAQGARAERARCAAIFAQADAGTVAQAANLAFNTGVSPREAKAILGSAPRGGGGLGARMKGRDPAPAATGGSGAEASGLPPELAAAQARVLATRRKER